MAVGVGRFAGPSRHIALRLGESAAKAAAAISILEIPKRSPNLSVCNCAIWKAIWKEINQRLRKQEAKWPKNKKETRAKYVQRLKRTARRLLAEFLKRKFENEFDYNLKN